MTKFNKGWWNCLSTIAYHTDVSSLYKTMKDAGIKPDEIDEFEEMMSDYSSNLKIAIYCYRNYEH